MLATEREALTVCDKTGGPHRCLTLPLAGGGNTYVEIPAVGGLLTCKLNRGPAGVRSPVDGL